MGKDTTPQGGVYDRPYSVRTIVHGQSDHGLLHIKVRPHETNHRGETDSVKSIFGECDSQYRHGTTDSANIKGPRDFRHGGEQSRKQHESGIRGIPKTASIKSNESDSHYIHNEHNPQS